MMHFTHNAGFQRWAPLVARILLSLVFIIAGVGKIMGFAGMAGYIASAGLPMPEVLNVLAIIVELGGGLMLITGYMGRIAAKLLFIFTFLTIVFFHNNFADQLQQMMALKNLAIMGGLLMVMVHGTGPKSLKSEDISMPGTM